jgi:RecB family exonuclease
MDVIELPFATQESSEAGVRKGPPQGAHPSLRPTALGLTETWESAMRLQREGGRVAAEGVEFQPVAVFLQRLAKVLLPEQEPLPELALRAAILARKFPKLSLGASTPAFDAHLDRLGYVHPVRFPSLLAQAIARASNAAWDVACSARQIRLRDVFALREADAVVLRAVAARLVETSGSLSIELRTLPQRGLFSALRDDMDVLGDEFARLMDAPPRYVEAKGGYVAFDVLSAADRLQWLRRTTPGNFGRTAVRRAQLAIAQGVPPEQVAIASASHDECCEVEAALAAAGLRPARSATLASARLLREFDTLMTLLLGRFRAFEFAEVAKSVYLGPAPFAYDDPAGHVAFAAWMQALLDEALRSAEGPARAGVLMTEQVLAVALDAQQAVVLADASERHAWLGVLSRVARALAGARTLGALLDCIVQLIEGLATDARIGALVQIGAQDSASDQSLSHDARAWTQWRRAATDLASFARQHDLLDAPTHWRALRRLLRTALLEGEEATVPPGCIRVLGLDALPSGGVSCAIVSLPKDLGDVTREPTVVHAGLLAKLRTLANRAASTLLVGDDASGPMFAAAPSSPEAVTTSAHASQLRDAGDVGVAERARREHAREQGFFNSVRTPVTGHIGNASLRDFLEHKTGAGAPLAVTSLEAFAVCPFRGFARTILGVRTRPQVSLDLSAREEGLLMHEALAVAFESVRPLLAERPRDQKAILERGMQTARTCLGAERAVRGAQRLRLLEWVRKCLLRALSDEVWDFANAELPFGESGRSGASGPPLVLADNVRLRGRIDRVDVTHRNLAGVPEAARVVDYKRGSAPDPRKFGQTALQLGIYAMVVSKVLGAPCVEGLYLTPSRALGRARAVPPEAWSTFVLGPLMRERVLALLESARQGRFSPKPTSSRDCEMCDARDICRRAPFFADVPEEDSE